MIVPQGTWTIGDAEAWVGKLMFGDDWFPPWALPNRWILPPLGSEADNLSARTLAVEYLDYRREFDRHFLVRAEEYGLRPPLLVQDEDDATAFDFSARRRDEDESMRLVRIAVPDSQYRLALRLNANVAGHWQRVAKVRESLVRNFASGAIQTFVRPEHGGQPTPFDLGNWHLEYWDPRFDTGRVDLSEPFPPRPWEVDLRPDAELGRWLGRLYMGPIHPAHPPSNAHWIFVEIESLYRAYGTLESNDKKPEESMAHDASLASTFGQEKGHPLPGNPPGRRSNIRLAEDEMLRRSEAGETAETFKEESEIVSALIGKMDHIDRPPSPKTIQNQLGWLYKKLSNNKPPK
ncbi:hypothetical protein [Xanthobacter autotrophicus]|uniref:hypothetical protein n=1 Tax=Xanthobacter autotrophicus TaxID=280 RepID=UPI003728BB56